jgi:hypothetical protein
MKGGEALMDRAREAASIPDDPFLPGAAALIGTRGSQEVERFVAAHGLRLLAERPVQAIYYPGRSMMVRRAVWAGSDVPEAKVRLQLCSVIEIAADRTAAPEPTTWAFPDDPGLPGLADAMDPGKAKNWVSTLAPGDWNVSIHPVAYRPRRRAVLRYDLRTPRRDGGDRDRLFMKVMTPADAERTWQLGRALREWRVPLALPSERPTKTVVAFDALPGRPMREVLLRAEALPSPARVADLLDQVGTIGAIQAFGSAGRPARSGLRHTRRLLRAILPDTEARVNRAGTAIKAALTASEVEPRPIHGDFYEGQVMVDDDFGLSLLDLDDMGMGDPALDAASFSAHMVALADSYPGVGRRLLAYRAMLREEFLRRLAVSPAGFAAREALVMLQLASGPFRVLEVDWPARVERRISLAEDLLRESRVLAAVQGRLSA